MLQCRLILHSLRIPDTRLYPTTLRPSEGETLPRKLPRRAKFARKWPTRTFIYVARRNIEYEANNRGHGDFRQLPY